MSGNEQSDTFEADNPSDQKFELVGQYPGQVKFSRPPHRHSVRPRRSNVEQLCLPGFLPSGQANQQ